MPFRQIAAMPSIVFKSDFAKTERKGEPLGEAHEDSAFSYGRSRDAVRVLHSRGRYCWADGRQAPPKPKQITPHIPVWDKSERTDGTFSRGDFPFHRKHNVYVCPAGKPMRRRWPMV